MRKVCLDIRMRMCWCMRLWMRCLELQLWEISENISQIPIRLTKARTVCGFWRKWEQLILFDFQVRHFPAHRQEILEELVRLNRRIVPDLVLAPSLHDVHQDHHTIAEEAIRAFKRTSILGYEEPWNNLTFNNQVYVTLEERHVEKKIAAVERYISQRGRIYASGEYIRALAMSHGVQIGRQYAEVFETERWIL